VRRQLGLICAAVVLLASAATGVLAQSPPWRIAQASDGTLYVLKDGARFILVADPIADDELAQYQDGGTTGNAVLLGIGTGAPTDAANPATGATIVQPAGALPPTTIAAPQFISVQGNSPGRTASVTVQAAAAATCSLAYTTPAGTRSTAAGLGAKSADASGLITWSFLIGGATQRGVGTISVTCPAGTITSAITIG
jgi:hypothetical protein